MRTSTSHSKAVGIRACHNCIRPVISPPLRPGASRCLVDTNKYMPSQRRRCEVRRRSIRSCCLRMDPRKFLAWDSSVDYRHVLSMVVRKVVFPYAATVVSAYPWFTGMVGSAASSTSKVVSRKLHKIVRPAFTSTVCFIIESCCETNSNHGCSSTGLP